MDITKLIIILVIHLSTFKWQKVWGPKSRRDGEHLRKTTSLRLRSNLNSIRSQRNYKPPLSESNIDRKKQQMHSSILKTPLQSSLNGLLRKILILDQPRFLTQADNTLELAESTPPPCQVSKLPNKTVWPNRKTFKMISKFKTRQEPLVQPLRKTGTRKVNSERSWSFDFFSISSS